MIKCWQFGQSNKILSTNGSANERSSRTERDHLVGFLNLFGFSVLVYLAIVRYFREVEFSVARGSIRIKKGLQLHDLNKLSDRLMEQFVLSVVE